MPKDTEDILESGEVDLPGQPDSQTGSEPSPITQQIEVVSKKLGELEAQLRAFQSDKDKGVAKVAKEMAGWKERLARYEELKAQNLTSDDAAFRMEVEQLLTEWRSEKTQPASNVDTGGTQKPQQTTDAVTSAVLKSLGLDPNLPEVVNVLRDHNSVADQVAAFAALAQKKATQVVANPATALSGSSGGAVGGDDIESLTRKVLQLQQNPVENMKELRAATVRLEQELKKK